MTLAEDLERLKAIDPGTWQEIACLGDKTKFMVSDYSEYFKYGKRIIEYIVQGCIQRACEKQGYEIDQNYRVRGRDGDIPKELRNYAVITRWDKEVHTHRGSGASPAEAILAAYLAAKEKA